MIMAPTLADLPAHVTQVLEPLLETATHALSSDLRSVVLYGSAAEQQLRPTSDVNVIFVLRRFDRSAIDQIREAVRLARAAADVRIMFLPEEDIEAATAAFPMKFADIRRRRRVLYGDDPFAALTVPVPALRWRLRQILLNFELRTRAAYVEQSLREEQLARVVANAAGPLRAAAASLLELAGEPAPSSKQALERVASRLPNGPWAPVLALISKARSARALSPGEAAPAVERLIELARELRVMVQSE
jgi:predicted nucleotidyltransferase